MNVYIDTSGDGICDKLVGRTDSKGKITLINQASNATVCVGDSNLSKSSLQSTSLINVLLKSKIEYQFITPLTDISV